MTQNEFTQLVETYGGAQHRWPEHIKAQMLSFMSDNPIAAKAILTEESRLDAALDSVRLQPGTDMLKARILNALPQKDVVPSVIPANDRRLFGHKAVAALMLFAFTIGFGGASLLQLPGANDDETAIYASQAWEDIATDYGMDDVFEWVGISEDLSPAP